MADAGTIGPAEQQYLQWVGQYFGEPEGTSGPVYVGALICALFLLGCFVVKGPLKWALVILTILSILLALGRNCMWLTDLMIDYMPMYSRFRTVESILVIAEFTMPLLAVMALQTVLSTPRDEAWDRFRKLFLAAFGVVLVVCLAGIVSPDIFGSPITDSDRATDSYLRQALTQQGASPTRPRPSPSPIHRSTAPLWPCATQWCRPTVCAHSSLSVPASRSCFSTSGASYPWPWPWPR